MGKVTLSVQDQLHASHRKVLEYVKRNRKATRAEIAKATGLSNQTLTRLTKRLIELKLIKDDSRISGQRGQPAIYLRLCSGVFVSIGIVFEHDRVIIIVEDLSGEVIVRLCQTGTFLTAEFAIKAAREMLEKVFSEIPADREILGIGISISGFFTNHEGRVCSRNDPIGWSKIDWQETFSKPYHCPCYVENDGCAASIGFSLSHSGSKLDSFFLIIFTLDIGGGFVFKGQLVSGSYGNAGEIACLFSSDEGAIRPTEESLYNYLNRTRSVAVLEEEIIPLFNQKDTNIMSWITACVESMKSPLKSIRSLFDPEAIVFAGRLPIEIRQSFAEKVSLSGPSFGDVFAPAPKILVDGSQNVLENGAVAIPAFYFFKQS